MTILIQQQEADVRVPSWVTDLASFRRWAASEEFPEQGRYAHLNGELWVDASMERVAHSRVKHRFSLVLGNLIDAGQLGWFLGDRMLLTNPDAALSTEPDGMFLSFESIRTGRVRMSEGEESVEVEGSPDMVLEVVSPTSRRKDTVVLRDLYWRAGVKEYWLAEPNRENATFEILIAGESGFVSAPRDGAWIDSPLFGRSFQFIRSAGPEGLPTYLLQVR